MIGGGPVGQLTSLAAQAMGAGVIVVVEPVDARRALAAEQGAVAATPDTARAEVDAVTDGRGADAVVDAVGAALGLDLAFALVRRRGTVVSVGVHPDAAWPLPVARAFSDELTLRFVIGDLMRDGDALVALLLSGALDPRVVASATVGLDGVPQAYQDMATRRSLKTLIALRRVWWRLIRWSRSTRIALPRWETARSRHPPAALRPVDPTDELDALLCEVPDDAASAAVRVADALSEAWGTPVVVRWDSAAERADGPGASVWVACR